MQIRADTLDDLLRRVFHKLHTVGRRIAPSRGSALEITAILLHLANPRARLSRSESRGRIFSALGELLWYLSGEDDLSFIRYYIPDYEQYSDDGRTIRGAYGPRLFNNDGVDQVAQVIALLRSRPDSRRAVIQLFKPADILQSYKDVPCTCTMQFLLRAGRLDMLTTMRSNDAFLGLPHDVFAFTMLQEIIARSVEADVGDYYHMVGSLHLYDSDRTKARQYLEEGWQATRSPMPPMPSGSPWPWLQNLLAAERALRTGQAIPRSYWRPYWGDLLRLLKIFQISKQGKTARLSTLKRQMKSAVYAPYIQSRVQAADRRRRAKEIPNE